MRDSRGDPNLRGCDPGVVKSESSGPIQHRNRLQEDLKAHLDAVSIEVRSAMYFEVCKRSMEAMML